jgi:hypothetical protein
MVTPLPPTFDPSALISSFIKRGVQLGLKDGSVTVIGASLSDQDRELIKRHKGAIVEVLSNAAVVA